MKQENITIQDLEKFATKKDLTNVHTELQGDIADVRTELKCDIADLKQDLVDVKEELVGKIDKSHNSMMSKLEFLVEQAGGDRVDAIEAEVGDHEKRITVLEKAV